MTPGVKVKSKKAQLLDWIRFHGAVKTHEVLQWGIANYSNRAERDARLLAQEGKIRRLTKIEQRDEVGNAKEAVWVICDGTTVERQMTLAGYGA